MPMGSPPRVRGKVDGLFVNPVDAGITPARAGKSYCQSSLAQESRDHPRACGEKSKMVASALMALGSPPRVRGKVDLSIHKGCLLGITPARAGKRRT